MEQKETVTPCSEEEYLEKYIKDISEDGIKIISDKKNVYIVKFKQFLPNIKITANPEKNKIKKEYEKIYELNELKINKFLSKCNSIKDAYRQIMQELNKNNHKIIIEENNQINIIIYVNHLTVKEIKFKLPEKNTEDNTIIKDLIKEIKNENKILKEEIDNLKNEIIFLKNENKKIIDKNNLLEEQIKNIINKLDINYEFQDKSSIIDKEINKQKLIINWIKEKTKQNSIKFHLIFKMSENGSKSEDFHKYCDNKGPTLILIKTNKNRTFGGFTPLNWQLEGKKIFDHNDQTFIFSLDLMKKYDMINPKKEAIYCSKKEGPDFGGSDFSLSEDMNKGNSYANSGSNFLSDNNLELTGGKGKKESFDVEEFEVYKVIY